MSLEAGRTEHPKGKPLQIQGNENFGKHLSHIGESEEEERKE
jgi:hypothetical protein